MKGKRWGSWLASLAFLLALGFWGYLTVRDTVPQGLVLGAIAPDFTLPTLDGGTVSLKELRGQPVLLRFSSRTCSFCYDDFDALEQLQRQYAGQLQVVAVEVRAPMDMVRSVVAGRNRSYPVAVDETGAVAQAYRLSSLPQSYFINAQGRLMSRISGELQEVNFLPHLQQALRADGAPLADLEEQVKRVAQELRCQECAGLSVWDSNAPSAWEMRGEIRERLEQGMTPQEVLDEMVDRYGVWILMRPPARGGFLWAYVTPLIFLALGGLLIRRSLRRRPPVLTRGPEAERPDPEVEARVQERLKEYL